jgi:hypothetical protein
VTPENKGSSTEKRDLFGDLAAAFTTIVRAFVAMGRGVANQVGTVARASRFFKDGKKPNLKKPGESKLSNAEQKAKAKEISQNNNWTKCLRGEKPEK